jgi:hypothetical protein
MRIQKLNDRFLHIVFLFTLLACEDQPVNESLLLTEPIVVEGDWTLDKVYQNEIDITQEININSFVLTLNYDGNEPTTYEINVDKNYPFVVPESSGDWTFDNLVFPSAMHFIHSDTTITNISTPLYPLNNSVLSLTFSLGCDENVYIYEFKKDLQ